ncbi:MAG: hypothetical protein QG641_2320 [Candidatus Poribacteria bacterium]|nr:hypothetical protein [Candidatus Poribacteria bacterium]
MTATEILTKEHNAIKVMLNILEEACKRLEEGVKVDTGHLEQMVEFIKGFADKCHHAKEEGLLFPAMQKAGIPGQGGPIGVMLVEHTYGREYVKGMTEAIEKYKVGDANATSEFIENAKGYVELLSQHIYKEDNILYPMADRLFSEEDQNKMLEEFDRVETEEMGVGTHEKYHEMLHQFQDIYLKK